MLSHTCNIYIIKTKIVFFSKNPSTLILLNKILITSVVPIGKPRIIPSIYPIWQQIISPPEDMIYTVSADTL